jgi:hypothetical protein
MPGSGPSFPSHVDTSVTSPSPAGLTCEVLRGRGESPAQARTQRSILLPAQGPRALVQWPAVSRGACGQEPVVDGVKAARCLSQRWTVSDVAQRLLHDAWGVDLSAGQLLGREARFVGPPRSPRVLIALSKHPFSLTGVQGGPMLTLSFSLSKHPFRVLGGPKQSLLCCRAKISGCSSLNVCIGVRSL